MILFQANLESAAATAAESQQRLAQQPDPSALYPELEQLRQYKIQSDTETSNLRNQLSHKQNEINTLQTKLNESSSRAGEVEGAKVELQKAKENAKVENTLLKFIATLDILKKIKS